MSGQVYAISDLHVGHENMAIKRGFKDADEMFSVIKQKWNETINKRDTVWILGDLTMEKGRYDWLDELNGIKKVVLGNHDLPKHVPRLLEKVNCVCSSFKYKGALLTHIPIHPCEINRFSVNIHGHTHEKMVQNWEYDRYKDDLRYVNVSCEALDYTPVVIKGVAI